MLRAIKTSHSGVGLGPHDEIERRQKKLGRRRMDDGQSPPIDESAENAAVAEPIIIMLMASRKQVMGQFVLRPVLKALGWLATVVMAVAAISMLARWVD